MSKRSYPRPLWRFHCKADQIDDTTYRVELVSDSGTRIVREGYNPLYELIRALGSAPEQEAKKESEATR